MDISPKDKNGSNAPRFERHRCFDSTATVRPSSCSFGNGIRMLYDRALDIATD